MRKIDLKSWLSTEGVMANVARSAALITLMNGCVPSDPVDPTGDARAKLEACHLQDPKVDVSKVLNARYVFEDPGKDAENGRLETNLDVTRTEDGRYLEFTPSEGETLPNEFDDRNTLLVVEDNTVEGVTCTDVINLANNGGGFLDWVAGLNKEGVYDGLRAQGNDDPRCEALCSNDDESGSGDQGSEDTTDGETDSSTGMIPDMGGDDACPNPNDILGGHWNYTNPPTPNFEGTGDGPLCVDPLKMEHKNNWQDTCGNNSIENPEDCYLGLGEIFFPVEVKVGELGAWEAIPPEHLTFTPQQIPENSVVSASNTPGAIKVDNEALLNPVDGGQIDVKHDNSLVQGKTITVTYDPKPTGQPLSQQPGITQ